MAVAFLTNSIWVNCSTSGLVDFTTTTALASFRTFADAAVPNGATVHYSARTATEFENGEGTYNSGTGVVTRTTIFASSAAGAKVNFGSSPTLAVTPLAEDMITPASNVAWTGVHSFNNNPVTVNAAAGTYFYKMQASGASTVGWGFSVLADGTFDIDELGVAQRFRIKSGTGTVEIPSGVASTSTTSGALLVSGGVGVGGAVNIGGGIVVTTPAAGVTTAQLGTIGSGRATITLDYLGGGNAYYDAGAQIFRALGGSPNYAQIDGASISALQTTASSSPTTGALKISGGAGVVGNLNVGGQASVGGTNAAPLGTRSFTVYAAAGTGQPSFAMLHADATSTNKVMGWIYDGGVALTAPGLVLQNLGDTGAFVANSAVFWRDGALSLGDITRPNGGAGGLRITSTTNSTSVTSGALTVAGGIGVGGQVTCAAVNAGTSGTITAGGAASLGAVSMAGDSNLTKTNPSFTIQDTGTGYAYSQYIGSNNTGGIVRVGVEGNTGGLLFTGTAAKAGVIGTTTNNELDFCTNNSSKMVLSPAGNLTLSSGYIDVSVSYKVNGGTVLDRNASYTQVYNTAGAVALYLGNGPSYYDANMHYVRAPGGTNAMIVATSGTDSTSSSSGTVQITGGLGVSMSVRALGAIGYSAGAGNTTTQGAGSGKGTGVTLNNLCGKITTDTAALAAGATALFVLTNSFITAADVLHVWHAGGGFFGEYHIQAGVAGAGTVAIWIKNIGASSRSDAVVIGFCVFKAVTT